ncbi:MAG: hypothetical protein AB7E81_17815 [Hyphomicrobiaceae bacterium]|jgi:hypothetical protein
MRSYPEFPLLVIGDRAYRIDIRRNMLVNTRNTYDRVFFRDVEAHFIQIARYSPPNIRMQCLEAAVAFDKALQRPRGSTSQELLAFINHPQNVWVPEPEPGHRFRRRQRM